VSSKIAPVDWVEQKVIDIAAHLEKDVRKLSVQENDAASENVGDSVELGVFDQIIGGSNDPFLSVGLQLHLNGESSACSTTHPSSLNLSQALRREASKMEQYSEMSSPRDKYDFDLLLTSAIVNSVIGDLDKDCAPSDYFDEKGEVSYDPAGTAFLDFCDMGEDRTPELYDHKELLFMKDPIIQTDSYTCHFHTRNGVRITSLEQLAELARVAMEKSKHVEDTCKVDASGESVCTKSEGSETVVPFLEIYAVQAGRVFMFSPKFVGEIFDLPHVKTPGGHAVSLEVLSLSPKVFEVKNFFADYEADAIVNKALTEKSESHRMKRSSTGASGYNLNSHRTSENAFDTHSKMAMVVKKRCFEVLGFDQYVESMADGLQVLRYNQTTAYVPHLDWIDDDHHQQEHNFDSAGVGTNRFATIFLYMSDLPDGAGGETVFTEAWPPHLKEEERMELNDALAHIRGEGVNEVLKRGSWEEKMVAQCRSKLAVRPAHAKAILFYSQHPNGEPDNASLHGGCPVLDGTKWGANLWVWNGPRGGYPDAPTNKEVVERNRKENKNADAPTGYEQLHATFRNTGKDPLFQKAELYFQETFWGKIGWGDPALSVNTYEGHEWNVQVDGDVKETWVITATPNRQQYQI